MFAVFSTKKKTAPRKMEREKTKDVVLVAYLLYIFLMFYSRTLIQIIVHKKRSPNYGLENARARKTVFIQQSDLCHLRQQSTERTMRKSTKKYKSLHMFQLCNREKVMRHIVQMSSWSDRFWTIWKICQTGTNICYPYTLKISKLMATQRWNTFCNIRYACAYPLRMMMWNW